MNNITLLHGSDHIIKQPELSKGKKTNDYGQGFYCTLSADLAKEWACKNNVNGFVNAYSFNDADLNVLNLLDSKYNVLNWIALLLKNRIFTFDGEIAFNAKQYILDNYLIDTSNYDAIIGYRADDSYFSYANAFIHNTIPIRVLSEALKLGKLGIQTVLVSEKATSRLAFLNAEPVDKNIYYPKYIARDLKAREEYKQIVANNILIKDDLFVIDIIRGGISNDDERIQQNLPL